MSPSHNGSQRDERASDHTSNLAAQASAGDHQSFGHLFRRVAPAIYTFACTRINWRWQDAEDAVAETWVRAWEKFESYDTSRSFRKWIFGFASRVVMEIQRKAARGPAGTLRATFDLEELPAEATNVSRVVARDESLREFAKWVGTLPEYEREVLILRGLQGWPHDRVAEALGRTVTSVKECWRRLLRKVSEHGHRSPPLADWQSEDSPGVSGKG